MPHKNRARRIFRGFVALVMMVASFAFVVLAFETIGWCLLRLRGEETHPFLYNREAAQADWTEGLPTRTLLPYIDPHLSHSPEAEASRGEKGLPGFECYGEDTDGAIRIVALGGSTTDPYIGFSWPEFLQQNLESRGWEVEVLNGGVAGYSSNQELLKLIRDVLPLQPDLVLSLSGINDVGFLHSLDEHPMVHPYQRQVLEFATGLRRPPMRLLPNALAAFSVSKPSTQTVGVLYGPAVRTTPGNQWLRNMRLMHAVAEAEHTEFLAFLQPVMGVGAYEPSQAESTMLEQLIEKDLRRTPPRFYREALQKFYGDTREEAKAQSYCVDLVDVFAERSGLYRDPRHQTEEGCRLLAEAIAEEVMSRYGDSLASATGAPGD